MVLSRRVKTISVTAVSFLLFVILINEFITERKIISSFPESSLQEETYRISVYKNSSNISNNINDEYSKSICSYFPLPFTASHVWKENIDLILKASIHPSKSEYSDYNGMKELLEKELPTWRLRKAIRSKPIVDDNIFKNIMQIIETKFHSIVVNKEEVEPITIAVFGGSVTVGRSCMPNVRSLADYLCAWPYRFEYLINQLFNKTIIKVYNMGIGGTSSYQGGIMTKYWMYPDELKDIGPDIIINSYSTNDAMPHWWDEEQDPIQYVLDSARYILQKYTRTVYKMNGPCSTRPPPLLIFLDDYIGTQQQYILGELSYNTALVQVSQWYNTFALSYADSVRDIVYKDIMETKFSAPWRLERSQKLDREVHFGMVGHTIMSWILAFGSLDLLADYCDDFFQSTKANSEKEKQITNPNHGTTVDDNTKGAIIYYYSLPPPLSKDLLFHEVSQQWQSITKKHDSALASLNDSNHHHQQQQVDDADISFKCSSPSLAITKSTTASDTHTTTHNPCEEAWFAGPGMPGGAIAGWFKKNTIHNQGWGIVDNLNDGWSNKLGWETTIKPDSPSQSTFTIKLQDVSKVIKVVTIIYLQSYGAKWENSRAKLMISKKEKQQTDDTAPPQIISSHILEGYHNVTASVSNTNIFVLNQTIDVGDTIYLQVDLISGTTFKIQGLMLCSY